MEITAMTLRGSKKRNMLMALMVGYVALEARASEAYLLGVGYLPGEDPDTWAKAVSADGSRVCGKAGVAFGSFYPFYWKRNKGIRGIDLPDSSFNGVSGDGRVFIGGQAGGGTTTGFYWTREVGVVWLPDLPGGEERNAPTDASVDGSVIVGLSASDRSQRLEAYRWTRDEGIQGLGDLPGGTFYSIAFGVSGDGNIVVGTSHSSCGDEAFRWTIQDGMVGMGDLPGGSSTCASEAMGISADGRVIVGTGWSDNGLEAFRWTLEDGMVALGDLPGGPFESHADNACADGSVIVGYGSPDFNFSRDRAFVWEMTHGMILLRDRLHDFGVDTSAWRTIDSGSAVSWDGFTVIGTGSHFDGRAEGFVAHFPCLEFCDRCTGQERMRAACTTDQNGQPVLAAKLRRAKPGAAVRFVLDYYHRVEEVTVGRDGRASVTWSDVSPGKHHIGLKECDASADVSCP